MTHKASELSYVMAMKIGELERRVDELEKKLLDLTPPPKPRRVRTHKVRPADANESWRDGKDAQ